MIREAHDNYPAGEMYFEYKSEMHDGTILVVMMTTDVYLAFGAEH